MSAEVAEVGRPQLHLFALPPSLNSEVRNPRPSSDDRPERPIDDQQTGRPPIRGSSTFRPASPLFDQFRAESDIPNPQSTFGTDTQVGVGPTSSTALHSSTRYHTRPCLRPLTSLRSTNTFGPGCWGRSDRSPAVGSESTAKSDRSRSELADCLALVDLTGHTTSSDVTDLVLIDQHLRSLVHESFRPTTSSQIGVPPTLSTDLVQSSCRGSRPRLIPLTSSDATDLADILPSLMLGWFGPTTSSRTRIGSTLTLARCNQSSTLSWSWPS